MFNKTKLSYYKLGAAMTAGAIVASTAGTANAAAAGGQSFGTIAKNLNASITFLPSFIASISYLLGVLLGVLGVMKIKDHVENPSQTPLKDGVMRICAGGMLFGLPIIMEAMTASVGSGAGTSSAALQSVTFNTTL